MEDLIDRKPQAERVPLSVVINLMGYQYGISNQQVQEFYDNLRDQTLKRL